MLNFGDRITIQGFVMMQGLEDGNTYEITFVSTKPVYGRCYELRRVLRSGKLSKTDVITHKDRDIHLWLNTNNNNRIVTADFVA